PIYGSAIPCRFEISGPNAITRSSRITERVEIGLKWFNHDQEHDCNQHQCRKLVDDVEKLRPVTILVCREQAAPASQYAMKAGQPQYESEFSPNPTHSPVNHPRGSGEQEPENPGGEQPRGHDAAFEAAFHDLA